MATIGLTDTASAQITEVRQYHNRNVTCVHSGIGSDVADCGMQNYVRVFIGEVESAIEVGETDKLLRLIPHEVFLGEPASEVMAYTNQACLRREVRVGEEWLFYLYRNPQTNGLVLSYNSPSMPVAQAQEDINRLRHLQKLGGGSLVAGHVTRIVSKDPWKFSSVPNHKVMVKGTSAGIELVAETDKAGYYEIEVPPGPYSFTANTQDGLWAPSKTASIANHACSQVNFLLHADGRIVGRVVTADGKPAPYARVLVVPVLREEQSFTVVADTDGHFEVGGREAGQYLIGAGASPEIGSTQWQPSTYYPDVSTKDKAQAIELGEGRWRADLKIKLQASTSTTSSSHR